MTEILENKKIEIYNSVNAENTVAVYGSLKQNGVMEFSNDPDKIQNQYYSEGYNASLIANNAQAKGDYASPLYVMSRELAYLQQVGIKRYLKDVGYQLGAIVVNIENNEPVLYYSLQDNNLNNDLDNNEYWDKVQTYKENPDRIRSYLMPDYTSAIDIKAELTTGYKAPEKGVICLSIGTISGGVIEINIFINDVNVGRNEVNNPTLVPFLNGEYIVDKDDIIKITQSGNYLNIITAIFCPFKNISNNDNINNNQGE